VDYTTLTRVKSEMKVASAVTVEDALLSTLITAASRAIDRWCTGVPDNEAVDYLKSETKTDEILPGQMSNHGVVLVYPHKPVVAAVSAFAYRQKPVDEWVTVDAARTWANGPLVEAYPSPALFLSSRCQVRITYTGGLASDVAALPADLVEAATLLSIRYYKESESGLNDAVGIAELATMIYTKAWPVRVLEQLQPFRRTVGWRHIA